MICCGVLVFFFFLLLECWMYVQCRLLAVCYRIKIGLSYGMVCLLDTMMHYWCKLVFVCLSLCGVFSFYLGAMHRLPNCTPACKWLVCSLRWFQVNEKVEAVNAFSVLRPIHSSFQHRRVIYANKYICQYVLRLQANEFVYGAALIRQIRSFSNAKCIFLSFPL